MEADDRIECRLCGKRFGSLGQHVSRTHKITPDEYRDRFGMRRSEPLTSLATRAKFSDAITRTIAAGGLASHYAGNGSRAAAAGSKGAEQKSALRRVGVHFPNRVPDLTKEELAAVIHDISSGTIVAAALKRARISQSGYHKALTRHPDLKALHEAAKARGKRR